MGVWKTASHRGLVLRGAVPVLAATIAASGSVQADTVDLNDWTAESYASVGGFGNGVWNVTSSGASVNQVVNGQPTVFFSDFNAFGLEVAGTMRVNSNSDDDYVGFVLGFDAGDTTSSSADFLLIDWKRGTQSFDFGQPNDGSATVAKAGLAVSRVTGVPTANELWGHNEFAPNAAGSVEELQRGATLGSTGYSQNTDYEFLFDFGPNNLVVSVNGTEELNIFGLFENGRLGFYNFSQANVTYSAFEFDEGSFPGGPGEGPDIPPVPLPVGAVLLLSGIVGLGAMRRRRRI